MNGWFLALIILNVLNIGINMAKHGESKNEKFNFWSALIGAAISTFLVYMAIQTGF